MNMTPQSWPDWYDGRHINEVLFCQQFLDKHPMKCVRGRLFTVDGLIEDEGQIGNFILEEISGVLTSGLSKIVTNLLASIKLQAYHSALRHYPKATRSMPHRHTPRRCQRYRQGQKALRILRRSRLRSPPISTVFFRRRYGARR